MKFNKRSVWLKYFVPQNIILYIYNRFFDGIPYILKEYKIVSYIKIRRKRLLAKLFQFQIGSSFCL